MPGKQGSFLCPTSAGSFSVTDVGFKPSIVFFFGGAKEDPEGGGAATDANIWLGVANRALEQWVSTINCITGANPTDATSDFSTTSCILTHTTASAVLFQASIVSIDNNGFTLNFTTAPATSRRIYYLAVQAKDAQFKIGTFTNAAATGNQSFTGVGFQPEHIFVSTGASEGTSKCFQLGYATTFGRFTHAINLRDGSGTNLGAATVRRISQFVTYVQTAGPREAISGGLISLDADGFTVNFSVANLSKQYGYVAFKGIDVEVGTLGHNGNLDPADLFSGSFDVESVLAIGATTIGTNSGLVGNAIMDIGAVDLDLNQCSAAGFASATTFDSNHYTTSTEGFYVRDSGPANGRGYIDEIVPNDGIFFRRLRGAIENMPVAVGAVRYIDFRGDAEATGPNFIKIKNNVEVKANGTHYMTIRHDTAGLTRGDFTMTLIKDGEEIRDIAIEVLESPERTYTFSFINDGTHDSQWQLLVHETELDTPTYTEAWVVKKKIVEQTVRQIQARQDSDGGFFQSSQGGG